jgi:hypothetical protein
MAIKERVVTARKVDAPVSGTDTITIACNLPHGLVLQLFEKVEKIEATPLGVRTNTEYMPIEGQRFVLRGNAKLLKMQGSDLIADTGGYALTTGVPRELYERWFEQNKHSAIVRNGLVFACESEHDAADEGKQRASVRSGFEPLDPA